jgi:hypothetical protein
MAASFAMILVINILSWHARFFPLTMNSEMTRILKFFPAFFTGPIAHMYEWQADKVAERRGGRVDISAAGYCSK